MKTYDQRMEEILEKAKRAKAIHRIWKASAAVLTVLALVIGVSLLWPRLNDFLLFAGIRPADGPGVYNSQPMTKPDPPHTCPEYVTYDVDVRTPEGKPIEGVDVYIFMNEDRLDLADYGITDANGQFSCVLDLSYHYVVSVDLPEHVQCKEPPEDYYKFSGSNCQIEIILDISEPPVEPTDPEKVYETYSVNVYTPEGAPAEGVTVYIYYHERDWWELVASGVTDANGQIGFSLQESYHYFASLSTPSFVDGSPEDYCNFDVNGQIVLYTSEVTGPPEDTETPPESSDATEGEDEVHYPKLIVTGQEITQGNSVSFHDDPYYVLLPFTTVIKALGAELAWETESVLKIAFNGAKYFLDYDTATLVKEGSSLNCMIAAPGSSVYYQIVGSEFMLDHITFRTVTMIMGIQIKIDVDDESQIVEIYYQ